MRTLSSLEKLEAESIHIIREAFAEAENPVMLYSIGKDSTVMLHLALKAFYPSSLPFPLLHVDTGWKFREMYEFRDKVANHLDLKLMIYKNQSGADKGINPFEHGSSMFTDIMKTEALKQALTNFKFDVIFGGARRDEEKSRAKERIFSFRDNKHQWDPKNQRPELWNIYNVSKKTGDSIRAFPLSNWTELDIWQYIVKESIEVVPLYFSDTRPVVNREGSLFMVDDERFKLLPNEVVEFKEVRFRTLGCYPLTAAVESSAKNTNDILKEVESVKLSERSGRLIDHDANGSMEKKKKQGYF